MSNTLHELAKENATKWVFETNPNKWSNNDDTGPDNFDSYKHGFLAGAEHSGQEGLVEALKEIKELSEDWDSATHNKITKLATDALAKVGEHGEKQEGGK